MFRLSARTALLIIFFWVALAVIGTHYSIQLYKNLRPEMQELLPETARSVIDINRASKRLASIDSLAVILFSDQTQLSRRFVDDLTAELGRAPSNLISHVESNIRKELDFFNNHRPLYIDLADLKKIRRYIEDRIQYEKQIRNPLNIFSEQNIPEPRLNFEELRSKYEDKVSTYTGFPNGYYATPDEKIRVVLIYSGGKATGVEQAKKIRAYVDRTISRLNPASYASDLDIHFSGDIQNLLDEHSALISDITWSSVLVTLLVITAIYSYFRRVLPILALFTNILMANAVVFGIAYFIVGYVNANTAFLGSIVLGNGINFGIILLARYLEERRELDAGAALERAVRRTAIPTATAALAAGVAYGSLILTRFRGFHQFGIIGWMGMGVCWLAAYTLLPAFLVLIERFKPIFVEKGFLPWAGVSGLTAKTVVRRSGWIWYGSLALTLVSLITLTQFSPEILEADLSRLRSRASMETGSGYYAQFVDQVFKRYLSPIAVLPNSRTETLQVAQALRELQKREPLISNVRTLDDFLPADQEQKIRVLQQIRSLLPNRLLARISSSDRELALELLNPINFKQISLKDLPPIVRKRFSEKDGTFGKMVLIEPPLGKSSLNRENLLRFTKDVRQAVDSIAPGTPIAGTIILSADILDSVGQDGPRATLFALLAVIVLIVVLFRRPSRIALALFTLLLAVTWMGGFILGFDQKINFLNFIALPITFGIGIDYGINIVQRYTQDGRGSILSVLRKTGTAVTLCSVTTIIGYGSLLIAQNRAFVSFALLAVTGEFVTAVAGLLTLSAFLYRRDMKTAFEQKQQQPPKAA